MEIKIENTFIKDNKYNVQYSTDYGKGLAIWEGSEPESGSCHSVEIEIYCDLKWEKDIYDFGENHYSLFEDAGITQFTGELEKVDDDGYAILRLGNSIITFMISGYSDIPGKFVKVEVPTEKVALFPTD